MVQLTHRRVAVLAFVALVLLLLAFLSGLAVGLTLWVPTETEISARRQIRLQRAALRAPEPEPERSLPYVLQTGSFADAENARRLRDELRKRGYVARVIQADGWHVVQAGGFPDADSASRAASEFTVRERLTALVRRAEGM